ncbi:MAG TPA: LytS/YhcK type 5TM receptor domain-containing protein, partial [Spirochaetota bacterium]|nr:LytS/YhcK type 5TM receptor domain-containing protein [Spirochaetota bacterium]
MTEPIFISLIHNASLLLAMALVFDMISFRGIQGKASLRQIVPGIILSVISISVMLTPWQLSPGLVFDTRSIVTSMSGLFFGFIPTAIVVVSSSVVRYIQGGDGTVTGILVILSTGTAGIAWRHLSRKPLGSKSIAEIYMFGITVHIIMLFMMFTLPKDLAFKVLPSISAPVMLIYPAGTALLGALLINRIKRERRNLETETSRDELERKTVLLNETQKLTKVGGWEWNAVTKEMFWTDEVYSIHGVIPGGRADKKQKLIELSISCYDPADQNAISDAFRKCATEGVPYDLEFPFTDKNGVNKWIRTNAAPVMKDGAITGVIGNIIDITRRKEGALALEKSVKEKELLMRELQHRVKNNLNIVTGILRLGEMNITDTLPKKIFTDARNRINAISSIYENLYQSSDISSIELHLYIDGLADSLITTYSTGGGRISLVKDLDRCSIELKRAVPLGLLVNELITNSIKYAFNGTNEGTITVRLKNSEGIITIAVE